jgi:hypothetical protein
MHYSKNPFPKDASQAARAFCEQAWIKSKSIQLLTPGMSPAAFFKTLLDKQHYTDAIRMIAHRFSRRQAIWWGCLCLEHDHGKDLTETEAAVLLATLEWVLAPSDTARREAGKAARAEESDSPAGLLGKAVFWSGGSLSKPEYPPVPPPDDICARAVASSVLLLAAQYYQPEVRQARRKEFLDLAFLVETGKLHWESSAVKPEAIVVTSERQHVEVNA